MNKSNPKHIIRLWEELILFLEVADSKDKYNPQKISSAYQHMFPKRTNEEYVYFKKNLYVLRDFFIESLADSRVLDALMHINPNIQSKIRNIASDYNYFEQTNITWEEEEYAINGGIFTQVLSDGSKKIHILPWLREKHDKLIQQIKSLDSEEQKMLWESRVADYIWYESSRSQIRQFIKEVIKIYENIEINLIQWSAPEKIVFNENGTILLYWTQLEKGLKPGTRYYKFFDILYKNINKRVPNEEIFASLDVMNGSKTIDANLSDIKSRMPQEIRNLIQPAINGYILDTSKF